MKKRILLAAVLAMALTLLCACAQRVQEMDESGYEVYFLSDPASAGGEDAICAQRTRLALDDTMETEDCVRALMEALPAQRADTAVLYMGHGSEHQANSAYALMEYAFHDLGRKDVVIGTVEGYPGFGEALRRLKERPQVRRVELRPLMTVAGDHAKNDLAGDEEDSWRRRLEAEGYETVCVLTGLGEHPAVRALFVEHARQAEQLQAEAC